MVLNVLRKHRYRKLLPNVTLLAVSALPWSWLPFVNVAELAQQPIVGQITVLGVLVIIVGINFGILKLSLQLLQYLYKRQPEWVWLLQAVGVWALTETAIAWLVAVIWMGPGGRIDTILPFFSATPFLMYTPLGYLSRFVGYFGLSAVFVVGVAAVVLPKTRRFAAAYWLVVTITTITAWGLYAKPNGPPLTATIVAEQLSYPKNVTVTASQLVVLPEYGLDKYTSDTAQTRFTTKQKDFYYVGSRQEETSFGYKNVLVNGSYARGFINSTPKDRLIPGGEHLSYWVSGLLQVFSPSTYSDFQVRRQIIRGDKPARPFSIGNSTSVGSAACSSIIAPDDYRRLTQEGANVLTNSASLEIFAGSSLFNVQHRGLSKFIASANARPFLQSSNNWQAFALDSNGRQTAAIDVGNTKELQVQTNRKRTPYTYLGEWVSLVGGLQLVWLFGACVYARFPQDPTITARCGLSAVNSSAKLDNFHIGFYICQ